MRNGISSGPLPAGIVLPFRGDIERACQNCEFGDLKTFSPLVAYAVKVNETANGTNAAVIQEDANPTTLLMPDGSNAGRGIFQLTSSWPFHWQDPYVNALYALEYEGFLMAAEMYWAARGLQGDDLVRAIAASFNAGVGGAQAGHNAGNLDLNTTDNYAARALDHYHALLAGNSPF